MARAHDGEIARRVAEAFGLLERGILLFVDDDQSELRQRREDREAGAEHDARLARLRSKPVAQPLRFVQAAVQAHERRFGEARLHHGFELRRKRDFRNEHQHLPIRAQHFLGHAKIDLGFPAARYTDEQNGVKAVEVRANRFDGAVLAWGERRRLRLG